jgi:type IV pilus assembly protein PilX
MSGARPISQLRASRSSQHGFVLAMALVFLLLLTIVGISAMSTTSLEEKMAHNIKDKTLSLQAAESALVLVERSLAVEGGISIATLTPTVPSSTDGLHNNTQGTPTEPAWRIVDWLATSGDFRVYPARPDGSSGGTALKFVAQQPRYIVEQVSLRQACDPNERISLPEDEADQCFSFRITARGVGGTNSAVTFVQGTYNKTVE